MTMVHAPAVHGVGGPDAAAGIAVENPATGEVIAYVGELDAAGVAELARRGRAAQPGWQALGFGGRARVMRAMRRWIIDNSERIVATIVAETGKTYEDAYMAEINYAGAALTFWAQRSSDLLADERIPARTLAVRGKRLVVRREPAGLVGVIGPWNFPLTNSFGDCIPALMAGNSVICKPSELTPLTSLLIAEGLAASGLPDGVFGVATGAAATGTAVVDEVDMVMFTGSGATGRKILERAARTLTPVTLELGGKDPMIVLDGADLERAANAAVYYAMFNGGQTCSSVERVYVEAPAYDAFVAKVVEKVRGLRQGPSTGPGTAEVGAVTFPPQLEIVERHVRDALDKGARALTGGRRGRGAGRFYEPTVLVDVDHSMLAMREETFGPTLPIMKVADVAQAIALANDSEYGLSASVFAADAAAGEAVARRLRAGSVCVNDAVVNYVAVELPMGGWKASGIGTRHGASGIRKYTRQQSLLISRWHLHRDPYMFPYTRRSSRMLFGTVRLAYGGLRRERPRRSGR